MAKSSLPKKTITLLVWTPSNAHLTLPANVPQRAISRHTDTPRGRKNAWLAAVSENADYTRHYGNCAARKIRIQYNGTLYDADSWEFRWGMDFSRSVMMTGAAVAAINRELAAG